MTLPLPNTIPDLIRASAEQMPDHIAILAPGRTPTTFRQFYAHLVDAASYLVAHGVRRNQRVAILVPDGSELATAFMIVASVATAIPFNPATPQEELLNLFRRAKITAALMQRDGEHDATLFAVAVALNLSVFDLIPTQQAGGFTLYTTTPAINDGQVEFAHPTDTAQIAFTSGTTSAAKIVPTLHNIHVERTRVGLTHLPIAADDRLLNVMPLHHAAGLNHVMRAVASGGSFVCLTGFEVPRFFAMLDEYQPTWFSAVATVCQLIVDRAADYQAIVDRHQLRYVRAGSMALPATLMTALENTFGIPIVQAYSSTETGIMASTGLEPSSGRLGSVGKPLNLTVDILDENGRCLPITQIGAIAVSGTTIFEGYEDDPDANHSAFIKGRFHTGDLGYFDEQGFLFITGRVKEVINRGGQKIAPAEVEDVLNAHPAVKQAVVFGIPDAQLGEDVGAAIVLHPDVTLTTEQIVSYLASKLALYKVPRRVVFIEALPVNEVGKIQRKKLAQQLGLLDVTSAPEQPVFSGPRTPTEQHLTQVWAEVLGLPSERISIHDKFQNVGGTSLSSVRLIFRLREVLQLPVTILDFFHAPTIAQQAVILDALSQQPTRRPHSTLTPIRAGGGKPPIYCFHALKGNVFIYKALAKHLESAYPIYGLQAVGVDDDQAPLETVAALAQHHYQQIIEVQHSGPYFLCGFSFGGRVALEVGRLLRTTNHADVYVCIIDDRIHMNQYRNRGAVPHPLANVGWWRQMHSLVLGALILPDRYRRQYFKHKLRQARKRWGITDYQAASDLDLVAEDDSPDASLPPSILRVKQASLRAAHTYVPAPYDGTLTYLLANNDGFNIELFKTLRFMARGELTIIDIAATHANIMHEPQLQHVAKAIQNWLNSSLSS